MRSVDWQGGTVRFLDQTVLPQREAYVQTADPAVIAEAIRSLRIRGAPAIGVAAAFGVVLGATASERNGVDAVLAAARDASAMLRATRPTAVNLFAALDRMDAVIGARGSAFAATLAERLRDEALKIQQEDIAACDRLAALGSPLIPPGSTILTHCNTGALAVVDYGTALGVIRRAHEQGKRIKVFADETRPRLQGARLTAWELMRWGIDVTLIADNAAGHYMRKGLVNLCLVGSDRTAANGDVANKIGTYKVAVLAKENGIPFYPVLPTSTIDLSLPDGDLIPIEERDGREVTEIDGVRIAPPGVKVGNPAFDVTPHKYVTGIVTENGIAYPPFEISLKKVVKGS